MTRPSQAVLITGCSSGIGRATAQHLHRRGWTVYATARRREALTELEAMGCRTLALDVTDEESMRTAVGAVEDEHGAVGVIVNNAGYSQSGAVETIPPDAVRRQFETNLLGPLRLTQLVLPGMRAQRWGKVVNLSSMGGRMTFPGGGIYHATKYALEGLSDVLRFEVAGFGIDVILIEPGIIRTGFGEAAVASVAAAGSGDGDAGDGDPYAAFNAAVAESTASAYVHGPLARLGGGPEAVAETIGEALAAERPRARYTVTPSARAMIGLRALLPDRAWDAFMGRSFVQPGGRRG
jgi:NAD(P)-dependent dehydrogenase (short-subunit alcohol dehydrogenase family)